MTVAGAAAAATKEEVTAAAIAATVRLGALAWQAALTAAARSAA